MFCSALIIALTPQSMGYPIQKRVSNVSVKISYKLSGLRVVIHGAVPTGNNQNVSSSSTKDSKMENTSLPLPFVISQHVMKLTIKENMEEQ